MRLKLDLHPIFNDSRRIEEALREIIDEAVAKRAKEVEIIPGKGTGALKKTVLRYLQRPEVKALYHRLEKDSNNWGRLFVHFRHDPPGAPVSTRPGTDVPVVAAPCACCGEPLRASADEPEGSIKVVCKACDSPNRLTYRRDRRGDCHARAELDYDDA